ncbi:hypothetical protein FRC04_010736 [Tulasnella sp. 424]|nr:hypothetical protein FRC04_010736 [Tulasnella sp. 424]KAG8969261.1 hypothetical protein FRC05_001120 [Tulasnella sp. 425]
MAPSLLTLSVLAASLAGVLADRDGNYIGDNEEWTPKFAATAWAPARRGSNNGAVHLFFTGSDGCNGIQQASMGASNENGHHRRANNNNQNQNQNNNNQNQNQNNNNQNQNQNNNNQNHQSQNQNQNQNNNQNQNQNNNQNQNQNNNNQNQIHNSQNQNQNNQNQNNQNQNQNNQNQNQNQYHNNNNQNQNQNQSNQNQNQNQNNNQNQHQNNQNQNVNNQNQQNNNNGGFNSGRWNKGYCFSNSGGRNNWNINTEAAFAVTSIGGQSYLADMRIFYWATGHGNSAVLKDAYYSTRGGHGRRGGNDMDNGRWKSGKLSKTISRANLGSLAATTWVKDGKVGRTVYYIQGGFLRELTLCDDGDSWDDEDRDGVELHFTPGEISAVSWIDDKGVLNKRVYVQNDDTKEVVEYAWSDATRYTEANNLYATPFVERGAAASAASLQVSRGKPNLYLWTVGAQGGNVKEDDDTHGKNAKAGTTLAAATGQGYGGSSYVFFLNRDGHLTQSNRDSDGHWHENQAIKMQNLD